MTAIDAGTVTLIGSAGVALMRRSAGCVDRVLQQMRLNAQFHN